MPSRDRPTPLPPPRHPGHRWRVLIFEARLTQTEVARRMRISTKALSRIINGHTVPTADTVARFARAVDHDRDKLWADVAAYQLAQSVRQSCADG